MNPFAKGSEEPSTDEGTSSDNHALFDEKAAVEEVVEEEEVTSLFESNDEEPSKKTVPYARFQKVIGERNQSRDKINELERTVAELNGKLTKYDDVSKAIEKTYADFKEPLAQMERDAEFLKAWEQVAKEDTKAQEIARMVQEHLGKEKPMTREKKEEAAAPDSPAADPRIEKLLEQNARALIDATLDGVKPSFKRVLSDHILRATKDLAGLTNAEIVKLGRAAVEEYGFKPEEILEGEVAKKPAKPPTKGSPGRTAEATGSSAEGDDDRKPAKTIEEWQANRDKIRKSILGG